jgi:hypothetical protein
LLVGVDTQRVQYKKLQKKLAEQGKPHDTNVIDDASQEINPTAASSPTEGDADGRNATSTKPLVGRLTDERIRRLQDLGFVWSLRDDWQKVSIFPFVPCFVGIGSANTCAFLLLISITRSSKPSKRLMVTAMFLHDMQKIAVLVSGTSIQKMPVALFKNRVVH